MGIGFFDLEAAICFLRWHWFSCCRRTGFLIQRRIELKSLVAQRGPCPDRRSPAPRRAKRGAAAGFEGKEKGRHESVVF